MWNDLWKRYFTYNVLSSLNPLWKERLNNDDQQYQQNKQTPLTSYHQQNKQTPLTSNHWT